MRTRTWMFAMVMVSCLLIALSTGGQMYWLFFLVMMSMAVLALASVLVMLFYDVFAGIFRQYGQTLNILFTGGT